MVWQTKRRGISNGYLALDSLAVVYIGLFFWLGLSTLRNGHGWLFFFGIFFPILWIFGTFSGPAPA